MDDSYEIFIDNKAAIDKVAKLVKKYPHKGHGHTSDALPTKSDYLSLNEIRIPTLILVGEYDILDVHAHAGAINAGIMNSKRDIIPKSGHLIFIEQPTLFNNKVKDFLEAMSEKEN